MKTKNRFRLFLRFYALLFLSFTFITCSDNVDFNSNEDSDGALKVKRLRFESFDAYNTRIAELSNFNQIELENWIAENNPSSLYNSLKNGEVEDEFLNSLPMAELAILNKESEFVLEKDILWLHEGKLYNFNETDNRNLLKSEADKLTAVGKISMAVSDIGDSSEEDSFDDEEETGGGSSGGGNTGEGSTGGSTGGSSGGNFSSPTILNGAIGIDARYQHEFTGIGYRDCNGNTIPNNARFKYVHELVARTTQFGLVADTQLFLRIKLEWRGRHRWKRASEPRDFTVNLNLSGTILRFSQGSLLPILGSNIVNRSFTCSGDQDILLKRSQSSFGLITGQAIDYPIWVIHATGTINHELRGGFSRWSHSAIW